MSNDKLKWISKKAFSYFDSKTSITLNASTETGMKTNGFVNFFPMKISFQASDSRMEKTNSRIKVELEYPQVNQLLDSLKKAMSGKNIFKTGATVGVFRYTQKNRKEIVFKFYHDNGPQITMKLSDPTSGAVSTSINLDENIYRTIFKFLTNFSENFNTIDAIYTQTLMSETSSDEIKQKLDNIDKRLLDLESQMKRSKPIYNVSNEGPIEPEEDAPIESTSLQENFNDMVNDTDGFSEVQLEKPFVPTKQSIKSTQPFIDNFLDWDMSKAKEWVASIVCTTDKAKPEYFSPLELVLNICGLDDDKRREYAGDKEFYKSQYIMTKFIKDNVNKALVSQSKYPTSVPAMKFGNTIKRGTQLYDFGIGAATVYLIYSAVVNNYLKLVNTNEVDMIKLDEYQRTLFVLKTILNPMIFSLEITNMFSDDLLAVFSNCVSSGMIDRFQKEYQPVTAGGSLFFSLELFDTMIKKLIGAIEHQPSVDMTDSIALDELMKKYDIGIPNKLIETVSDVKDIICNLEKEVEEKQINITPRTDSVAILDIPEEPQEQQEPEPDDKLELFLECATDYTANGLIGRIRDNCQAFSELGTYFKKEDIPSEIFKIKRIMDIDSSLSSKNDVLKMSKLLKEDSNVTESRVMQQDEVSVVVSEEPDIENVFDLMS